MARKRARGTDYETLREASGWYMAAWRDFRSLTLEELSAETGIGKGRLSDFENGTRREAGTLVARINRDALELISKALGTTPGRLIDVNPFNQERSIVELQENVARLPERDREEVQRLVETLQRRQNG